MEFHIPDWRELLQLFQQFPVLGVLVGGQVGGVVFTQILKKTYLAFTTVKITVARYQISVWWLSVLLTYLFSLWGWRVFLHHTGAEEIICVIAAGSAPYVYRVVKSLVKWKFPEFAKTWGDNGQLS